MLLFFIIFLFISPHPSVAEGEEPIRIGIYTNMSGTDAPFGQSVLRAIKIAHKLRPIVLEKGIELHFLDTKSEEKLTSQGAEVLIKTKGVAALIDGTSKNRTLLGSSTAEEEKIPIIYPFVTHPLPGKSKRYAFTLGATDSSEARAAALFAVEIQKANKASVMIDVSRDYSIYLSSIFMKSFIETGGKVVSATYYQSKDLKVTEQITPIIAAKPDILYLPNYTDGVALVFECAMELDLRIPMISSIKAYNPGLVETGKPAVNDLIVPGYFAREAMTSDIAKEFIAAYEQETEEEITTTQVLSADSYFLLINAIERAKSSKGDKIRNALTETKNFDAVSGKISIDVEGNSTKSIVFHRIKEGKLEYITKLDP
ncbi:MAG: ABC transporter substrate-binding protein [Deltaproteobacteria bacterium]|nr:ABC transporter substrate-binding protein [Deltaproteobacteria bacterium]